MTKLWVDVSVIGSLHGRVHGQERSMDPLPMIAGELLNHADVQFASAAALQGAVAEVLRRGFEEGRVRVNGQLRPFRFLRKDNHWAALHDLEPDHLLYIVASNSTPADLKLETLDNLAAYSLPASS
jgi:hypothetical protein